MKRALVFISAFLTAHFLSYAQLTFVVDSSSINAFFSIAQTLSEDKQPTSDQWQALRKTKGYQFIFDDLKLKESIKIAFSPSESQTRDSLLSLDTLNFQAHTIRHLLEAQQHGLEIKTYLQRTDFEALLRQAHANVRQFIPKRLSIDSSVPPLYLAIFQPDAYAQNNVIIADLSAAKKVGKKAFVDILTHELYHYYRAVHLPFLDDGDIQAFGGRHYPILKMMVDVQNEGSADLIDKTYPPSPKDPYFKLLPEPLMQSYQRSFYDTPTVLEKIDSLLVLAANDTGYVSNEIYKLLDFGGHPQGFYMSSLIKEKVGLQAIVNSFDNPVAFIRLYNQAARDEGIEFVFSLKAMDYLEELEKQYFTQ